MASASSPSPLRKEKAGGPRRSLSRKSSGASSQRVTFPSTIPAIELKTCAHEATRNTTGAAADDDDDQESEDVWDISRLNQNWEIDAELRRNLPYLARSKRKDSESPGDKFLRLSRLALPAAPESDSLVLDGLHRRDKSSRRAITMTPETKAKYFGKAAKQECYGIFRKLAAQKYLTLQPLDEFLDEQQQQQQLQDAAAAAAVDTESVEHLSHRGERQGLFTRQFTARHRFSSLCLEKDLPPCIRLIVRNYYSPEINVSHMAIGDDLACVFAACLGDLPMVTGLNIRNNRLQDRGLEAIVDMVIAKRDLYHLDLSENKVDGRAASALASYMGSAGCALQTLKLNRADVDDNELAPFAKALHTNRSLQTLDLSSNMIGSTENLNVVRPSIVTGGEALATMLSINATLTVLDLSWNYLRLEGAVEIGRALAYNSGVRELNLAYNAFGNMGAQTIGESLQSNNCLEILNLSNNNIPSQGAVAIASALKANSRLVQLTLDGNPLGENGGRALLHAVADCTDRQLNVSMDGCNFDVMGAGAFDPSESTGSYDLNLAVPYERAIALELLRVANTKQGCKFLSIVHTDVSGKQKRNIKVELREVDGSAARRRLLKTAGIVANPNDDASAKQYKLDRESLEELFQELDADDSGSIDDSELLVGMRRLGLVFRDEDVPRYVAQYDLDGTGMIELEEFVELMASFHLERSSHFDRQCVDLETEQPFEIPTDGRLQLEFIDFHVSTDHDNAHSTAGVERLIENISASKNKAQMLGMAKSGLYFKSHEAQLLLETVADVYDVTQAVMVLLPNMVDVKHAFALMDQNLDPGQRLRVQHLMGSALQPILALSTGHYRVDLSNDTDRLALKKLVENSSRTAFIRKKDALKDTSQHQNYHGFRNETLNGKPLALLPAFLDTMPKFGMLEFDYVQLGRGAAPIHAISNRRFDQVLRSCGLDRTSGAAMGIETSSRATPSSPMRTQASSSSSPSRGSSPNKTGSRPPTTTTQAPAPALEDPRFPVLRRMTPSVYAEVDKMKTIKNYIKFGDGWTHTVELVAALVEPEKPMDQEEDGEDSGLTGAASVQLGSRQGKEVCTARAMLFHLQWFLATRWISVQQAIRLLAIWPRALAEARVDAVCVLYDRIVDLHNFNGVLSALADHEAAQCIYRIGWLNLWSPLQPDDYYELHMAVYEEREVAKALVRLAIDEPGENWQGETFGWTREEPIPGWELNLSWLKDGGFPEKGHLCLEYYSGADKGCGPVWPTRRELAAGTLAGLPTDDRELDALVLHVDALTMRPKRGK